MKAILISIHPKWVELILNHIKKDEIRKGTAIGKSINKLIEEQGVAPMLIYCTKNEYLYRTNKGYFSSKKPLTVGNGTEYTFAYSDEGKVVARFNATADLLELKMIEGGLYFTTPDRDCFTPDLDLNENAQIDNWQLLRYTGEKLGTQISDIHISDLEIFDEPKELSEFYTLKCNQKKRPCNIKDVFGVGECYDLCKMCKPLTKAPQSWCYVEVMLDDK